MENESKDSAYIEELKSTLVNLHKAVVQKEIRAVTCECKTIKRYTRTIPISVSSELIELFESTMVPDDLQKKYSLKRFPQLKECPEVRVFIQLLHLSNVMKNSKLQEAFTYIKSIITQIKSLHRATIFYLNAQAYYFLARVAELNNKYSEVRSELFEGYTNAQIHGDLVSLAVITNCLLRYYILSNQYELASQLISKGTFPEQASNNQTARYLYYQGKISSIQLEYSDAHTKLLIAARKSPQKTARGFRTTLQKLLIIVELLMGEIPERTIFSQEDYKASLIPYFQLVQAVRTGNLIKFGEIVSKYKEAFNHDGIFSLIQRLRHNVLKLGLRKIYLSYSRISFGDICEKLHLESVQETEYIVAKAIRDGVIEATINHEEQYVQIKPQADIYASNEPMEAFDKRIKFCLDLKNEAEKALEYPKKKEKIPVIPVKTVNDKLADIGVIEMDDI